MHVIPVLYEDNDILIINKQSGLAVQGGEGILHPLDEVLAGQIGQKVYLVHRLDKDTAGILVVAKNPKAAAVYTEIFAGKKAVKEYIAFCAGTLPQKSGTINFSVDQKGTEKSARTHYQLETESTIALEDSSVNVCRIRWRIETGRMHQIRIHAAKLGVPIIADDKHGNFKINKLLKKACGAKKLMLASVRLTIPLNACTASKGQGVIQKTFEIPLPEHMQVFAEANGL